MKNILFTLSLAAILVSCDVNKTEKGELPEVDMDVSYEEGNLPEYEVNWADVNVGTTTEVVEVPKVKVVLEEETIEVPVIDVDMPDEEKEELSVVVEAEVSEYEHELDIVEIRAANDILYVISKLEKSTTSLDGEVMRVQDQVELNAPDLSVKYIIVGERPDRSFNKRYKYVTSMNNLPANAASAKVIYTK